MKETILIIKLGALGDFILADAAFDAIRRHHPKDHIVLLTTPSFEVFAKTLGYFDEVFALPRFSFFDIRSWKLLLSWFRAHSFSRVYDLQMVNRTKMYYYVFKIIAKMPFEWVGHLAASPYYLEQEYFKKHPKERFDRLLGKVGIYSIDPLNIQRLGRKITVPELRSPYVLLVPSASNAFDGAKKWPLAAYKELTEWLTKKGYNVVIVGGPGDDHSPLRINDKVHDLTGKTSFENVIDLATHAFFAVGNDTGPIHMAAASLCPVFVLFSTKAPPAEQVGARGPLYHHLSANDINTLSVEEVIQSLVSFIEKVKAF
ncbi:MAG: glycosyltransferase family 9 protein [Alphaproteobacteria bacterium]|nr:glycosyltransferase family 9 protein [Alphaproteobacteria bacterium]